MIICLLKPETPLEGSVAPDSEGAEVGGPGVHLNRPEISHSNSPLPNAVATRSNIGRYKRISFLGWV